MRILGAAVRHHVAAECKAEGMGLLAAITVCFAYIATLRPVLKEERRPGADAGAITHTWQFVVGTLLGLVVFMAIDFMLQRGRLIPLPVSVRVPVRFGLAAAGMMLLPMGVPGLLQNQLLASVTTGVAVESVTIIAGIVRSAMRERVCMRFRHRRGKPFDQLSIRLVRLIAYLHRNTGRRISGPVIRSACDELEILSYLVQREFAMPGRASRKAREPLAEEARRVALVLRRHGTALAAVSSSRDVRVVVESMLHGMEAFAVADREALLAHAPAEAEVSRRATLVARLWPAVVLVASGVLVPMLPAVADRPGAADSLRWMLLVTGALTLVAPPDTIGRVTASMDKAVPWK
ncbi:hypothetical protein ACIQBJ_18780 [Kitasatospora sp. NPDC088391]|uniref:hypothetical protein n=1 Tax=Kitasatospora sp. NPDC088391 TaxID=3364074 RepID=UPI00382292D9